MVEKKSLVENFPRCDDNELVIVTFHFFSLKRWRHDELTLIAVEEMVDNCGDGDVQAVISLQSLTGVSLTMIYFYLYQRLFEILYNDFQTMIFSPVNNGFMDFVPTIYKADFKQ